MTDYERMKARTRRNKENFLKRIGMTDYEYHIKRYGRRSDFKIT